MAFPLLNISPSQLDYQFEADREIKATLNLRNTHDARVAFKIKTTASDRFVVCPPAGICEPGTVRLVKIYLRPHRSFEDELRYCKDRFLVQSIVVDQDLREEHVVSDLFRSGQRQEAKLKVQIAPPLAHSSVLEAEIRNIALRQGVEGHRTVVRKFSELLLARGIISQAQVVLAFSTVGEIFQGMQTAYKASTADREVAFNRFLEGTSGQSGAGATKFTLAEPAVDSSLVEVPPLKDAAEPATSPQESNGIPGNYTAAASTPSPPAPTTPQGEPPQLKENSVTESPNIPRSITAPPTKTQPLTAESLAAIEEQERLLNGRQPGPQWGDTLRPIMAPIPAKRALQFEQGGQPTMSIPGQGASGATNEKEERRRIALSSEVQPDAPTLSMAEATSATASAGAPHATEPAHALVSGADDKIETEQVERDTAANKVAIEPTQVADVGAENRPDADTQFAQSAAGNSSAPGSVTGTPRPADLAPAPVWIDRLATPALPRTTPKSNELPAGFRISSNGVRSADAQQVDQNKQETDKVAIEPPAQPIKVSGQKASKKGTDGGAVRSVLAEANGAPEALSPQVSQNGILRLDSGTSFKSTSSAASPLGVPIPLGNTAKMAGLFGTRSSGEAQKA